MALFIKWIKTEDYRFQQIWFYLKGVLVASVPVLTVLMAFGTVLEEIFLDFLAISSNLYSI